MVRKMRFDIIDMDKIKSTTFIICGCGFCKNEERRTDVRHFKMFSRSPTDQAEFYLNICESAGLAEIVKKE